MLLVERRRQGGQHHQPHRMHCYRACDVYETRESQHLRVACSTHVTQLLWQAAGRLQAACRNQCTQQGTSPGPAQASTA